MWDIKVVILQKYLNHNCKSQDPNQEKHDTKNRNILIKIFSLKSIL